MRLALRRLLRSPGFTLVAVLTLGLGVAANVTVFSVFDFFNRQADDLAEPDRLVLIEGEMREAGRRDLPLSTPRFEHYRAGQSSFAGLAASDFESLEATGLGDPFQAWGRRVNAAFFEVLGVRPVLGRTFRPEEEESPGVVMISAALWRERFGADPHVLSRRLTLNGVSRAIIGVLPPLSPYWSGRAEVWLTEPFGATAALHEQRAQGAGHLRVIGRLRPGVTPAQAQADLLALHESYRAADPARADAAWTPTVKPLAPALTAHLRGGEGALFGAVACVLALAAGNVANLLFARFAARRRELAVRMALGARRGAVVRLLLWEGGLVGAAGGGLGLGLARGALHVIPPLAPDMFPVGAVIELNVGVLGVAAGLALGAGLGSALLPAWWQSDLSLAGGIKGGAASLAGAPSAWERRLRQGLVALQVGLSLVLLAGATLLLASFRRLSREELGFRAAGVSFGGFFLPPSRYPDAAARARFARQIAEELRALPGVGEAAVVSDLPLTGGDRTSYARADGEMPPPERRPRAWLHHYGPGAFSLLGVPLRAGRDFLPSDAPDAPAVVVVSRRAAERLFPGENPLGRRVRLDDGESEIVGVAGDVRSDHPSRENDAEFYRPLTQRAESYGQIAVRGPAPAVAFELLRAALRRADPALPLLRPQTLDYYVAGSVGRQRLVAVLVGSFASVAVAVAVVGIAAAVACAAAARTRELGIRAALGAGAGDLRRLVVGQGMRPVLAGLAVGTAGALAFGRVLASQLHGVTPHDPALLILAGGGLLALAALACWLPARRAARADPCEALRAE